jgi:hypothetical protein
MRSIRWSADDRLGMEHGPLTVSHKHISDDFVRQDQFVNRPDRREGPRGDLVLANVPLGMEMLNIDTHMHHSSHTLLDEVESRGSKTSSRTMSRVGIHCLQTPVF